MKQERNTKFKELYEQAKAKPTPAQEFIATCAKICCVNEMTVRYWIGGSKEPNQLRKKALAEHFGVDADSLFKTSEEIANDLLN